MEVTNYGRSLDDFSYTPQQRVEGRTLGQEDFLRVMVEQLRHQNPLEPQDNSDFFAQIAQFESLDAMRGISKAITALVEITGVANAASMVGRTVTAEVPRAPDPETGFPRAPERVTGEVTSVSFEADGAVLHLEDRSVPARLVVEVA